VFLARVSLVRAPAEGHRGWWAAELAANAARDRRADAVLTGLGWRVLRFWEHEDPDDVVGAICAELSRIDAAQDGVSVVPPP
jgi:DNA mismatch endonuclease (patch repair protein)